VKGVPSLVLARNDLELVVDVRIFWDSIVAKVTPDVFVMSISEVSWALDVHLVSWFHLWEHKVEASNLLKMRNLELYWFVSAQLLPGVLDQHTAVFQLSSPVDPSILPWLTLVSLCGLDLGGHGDLREVYLYLIWVVLFIVIIVLKDLFHILLVFGQSCLFLLLIHKRILLLMVLMGILVSMVSFYFGLLSLNHTLWVLRMAFNLQTTSTTQ
jgi:hypothetical protein